MLDPMESLEHIDPEELQRLRNSLALQARNLAMLANPAGMPWQAAYDERPHIIDADRTLYEPSLGLFGVFGIGIKGTGALAASSVVQYVREHDSKLTSPRKLATVLAEAGEEVYRNDDTRGSQTTAIVAKLTRTDGGARAIWASAGNSPPYRIGRDGLAKQIGKNRGQGNAANHALGQEHCEVEQYGQFKLAQGEDLILATNNILSGKNMSQHFYKALRLPKIAAQVLLLGASKPGRHDMPDDRDDRAVIVIAV